MEVEHFQPHEIDRMPREGFDLYLNIDDGLRYHLPPELRPSAFWAIDTHLDFDRCREKAPGFDVVFAAQRDGVDLLRGIGVSSASWLPLACDPEIHRKHELAKQYDVAFVGNIFPGPRGDLLALIQRRYPNSFVGQCYFDDMARTYSAARIAFNRSIRNDVNMRVFEAVACGSLLLTNDLGDNGLGELFRDGVHLATYREPEDLLDKLAFYLEREALRERIAAAGRAEAIAKHTYGHRMETLLKTVQAALSKSGVSVGWVERIATHQEHANDPAGKPEISGPDGGSHTSNGNAEPDPFYFGYARPEVVQLVPETARRVLDIGCGAGRLGEAIKQRQAASVSGIEFDSQAAAVARQRLDQVWVGDVEQLDLQIPPGSFDAIVCADVLEHLREPGRLLRKAREWLSRRWRADRQHSQRAASQRRPVAAARELDLRVGRAARSHPFAVLHPPRDREALPSRGLCHRGDVVGDGPGDDPSQRNGSGPVQLGRLCIDGLVRGGCRRVLHLPVSDPAPSRCPCRTMG